jgi:ABC-type transporter Mla subunit MlaD
MGFMNQLGYYAVYATMALVPLCVYLFYRKAREAARVAELEDVLRDVRKETEEAIGHLDSSIEGQEQVAAELERRQQLIDHLSEAVGIIQKSRDKWKDMFFVQAAEHGNGQALLERALTKNRQMVHKLAAAVNVVRKEKGQAPITKVEQLDEPPIGTAEAYRAAMRELADRAPEDPDMVAERDRLLAEAKADDEAEPDQPSTD